VSTVSFPLTPLIRVGHGPRRAQGVHRSPSDYHPGLAQQEVSAAQHDAARYRRTAVELIDSFCDMSRRPAADVASQIRKQAHLGQRARAVGVRYPHGRRWKGDMGKRHDVLQG
jgi:hypothetical protein